MLSVSCRSSLLISVHLFTARLVWFSLKLMLLWTDLHWWVLFIESSLVFFFLVIRMTLILWTGFIFWHSRALVFFYLYCIIFMMVFFFNNFFVVLCSGICGWSVQPVAQTARWEQPRLCSRGCVSLLWRRWEAY